MSNIENLVAKITTDSHSKAKAITDEANATANAIIAEKVAAANAQSQRIAQNALVEAARNKAQIIEGENLKIRDSKLRAKQDAIAKTFEQVVAKLKNMSQAEYALFLENYLMAMPIAGNESIVMPKQYQDIDLAEVNAKLKANGKPCNLTVNKSDRTVDSGFILVSNGSENDNTFESLIDFFRESLEVMVVENLF